MLSTECVQFSIFTTILSHFDLLFFKPRSVFESPNSYSILRDPFLDCVISTWIVCSHCPMSLRAIRNLDISMYQFLFDIHPNPSLSIASCGLLSQCLTSRTSHSRMDRLDRPRPRPLERIQAQYLHHADPDAPASSCPLRR